jgi:hypothetical protein
MKIISMIIVFILLIFVLIGCSLVYQIINPTQIEPPSTYPPITTALPTIVIAPKNTIIQQSTLTNIPTLTITPINTLEPEVANEKIKNFLTEPIDCTAPCFWGITPGQTTAEEARNIFKYFGLQVSSIPYAGKIYDSIDYNLTSGLSLSVTLTIKDDIVENIQIKITPEEQKTDIPKEWLAYSPETLIKRYGQPSRIDFLADWGPRPLFSMQMYYDEEDLIIQYTGFDLLEGDQKSSLQFCPLTAQFDGVWLWVGKNPHNPPGKGVSLEDATSLTLEDFSKIMTGNPDNACIQINGDLFP